MTQALDASVASETMTIPNCKVSNVTGLTLSKNRNPAERKESKYSFRAIAHVEEVTTGQKCTMRMECAYICQRLGISADSYAKLVKKKDPAAARITEENNFHLIQGDFIVRRITSGGSPDAELALVGCEM